ncbi:Uncharacterised protein [uncultured archaeon]|nr:Uncharacterised protein [uncultured archaeon]
MKSNNLRLKLNLFMVFIIILFTISFTFALSSIYIEGNPEAQGLGGNGYDLGDNYKTISLSSDPGSEIGTAKNVNIKTDSSGTGIVVEFKKDGSLLSKSGEDWAYNVGVEPGGKFYFDSKGKFIKADFKASEDWTFPLNGYKHEVKSGTQLKLENGEVSLDVRGGSFSFYPEKDLSKRQSFSNIKDGGSFNINSQGKVINANFEVDSQTDIVLRGYKYKLAANSKVSIDGNKVGITIPDGTKLEEPKKTEDAESDTIFSFSTKSGGALVLPNGDLFETNGGTSTLYFKDNGFYFNDKNAVIKNSEGKNDFFIQNANNKDVYLVFDKDKISKDLDSIFIGKNSNGKDTMILTSLNAKGPAVFFAETNRYGIGITSENTASVQANKGKVFIEKAETGNVASIKISGESIATLDRNSLYGEGGELYFDPTKQIESDFKYGKSSPDSRIVFVDNEGNKLKDFEVYSNNRNQYASVPVGTFKGSLDFFKAKGDFYVSSSVAFNQLTPEQQKFYDESINSNVKEQLANYISQDDGKDSIAALQRTVEGLRIEEEERRKNPPLASVRLHVDGYGIAGSGTVVGVDKEGYPLILTAGHVTDTQGQKVTADFVDGKKYSGTVLGGYSDSQSGSGWDLSLIRLDTKIDKISYVPIASAGRDPQEGGYALRIGCPNAGPFKQTETLITQVGTGRIWTQNDEGVIGGESGGGLFYNGRLVGVTSIGGGVNTGYATTEVIRQFLQKQGYGYLIAQILSIVRN